MDCGLVSLIWKADRTLRRSQVRDFTEQTLFAPVQLRSFLRLQRINEDVARSVKEGL